VLEALSFEAPDRQGDTIAIDAAEVRRTLEGIYQNDDVSRFIL
jgi:ATP-dependent HslUV protease ATP-binding subunit HslU